MMVIIVGLLAITYLAMFPIMAIYAKRTGRSALWWIFLSLTLTPFIAFIMLRGGELEKRRAIKR
jgi:hypothetical membrane protein